MTDQPTPSTTPADPSPFDKDAAYLNQTLRHERMELALDDSVSLHTIGLIIVRAWLAAIIPLAVFGVLGAIMLFSAADSGGDISGASLMLSLAIFSGGAVFWLVLLLAKVTEPIGEWRVLLAERWSHAESYHRMIAAALYRRAIPLHLWHKRVVLNAVGRPVKHTIVLTEGDYQAYVTVFPYGTSLYVGWQMWRRRSGAQLIGRALVDRFSATNIVAAMLRTDRPRAMREAVHLACREAVYQPVSAEQWDLAMRVDLGELVDENTLLQPQQPSPVIPAQAAPPPAGTVPAPPPPAPAPRQGPDAVAPAAPAATAATQAASAPEPPASPAAPDAAPPTGRPIQPDPPLDESLG